MHLGDLVDRRKFISYLVLTQWRKRFIGRLAEEGIETDVLVGNHDTPYKSTNTPNAIEELFSQYGNIRIFSDPTEITIDGLLVSLVPWINTGNYEKTLDHIKSTKAEICFGHLELSGFEMNRGNVCLTGMDRKTFEKFEMVISGHFHHKSTDGHIYYLGTQYEIDWSDYNDPKGFHVFDTNTRELTFIENPYHMFHKIMYDDKEDFTFEKMKETDWSVYKDTYVKVVVTAKSNPYLFDTFLDTVYNVGPIDINVVENFLEMNNDDTEEFDQAEDTMTLLGKYIDGQQLEPHVNPDHLKNVLREIYVEAINLDQA